MCILPSDIVLQPRNNLFHFIPANWIHFSQEAWRPKKLCCKQKFTLKKPKHTPNKHVILERCETSGKYLKKWMTNDLNHVLFGAQNDPEIGLWDRHFHLFWAQSGLKIRPVRSIFSIHQRVLAMSMWSNTAVKPGKTCFEEMTKDLNFTNFGAQNGPKIGSLRSIFLTSLKVLAMSMWNNTMWNMLKLFEKVTKIQNFDLFWVQNDQKNWAFETHIFHIYDSSSNEQMKQDWYESSGNLLTK